MADAFIIYNEGFNAGLKPDPLLNISEWADKYRVLSQKASAEPGKWRTSRTPYLKEIMDCLSPYSGIERVVFMKGAQIGGTEVGNNFLGYIVHLSPGPVMLVMPTVDGAKRTSKTRIDPMFAAIPELKGVISDRRSKDASNTTLMKEFQGGVLVLTGANSAIGLRSMPVRYIFLDEIDAYKGDVEGEGDPVNLAIKRTSTFNRRKIFMVSTPTIQSVSRIEYEYEQSDQRHYMVPCPYCNKRQLLKWKQIHWEDDDPQTAVYICEYCGGIIEEHHKTWMLENGIWEKSNPSSKIAGFHLSSLYSPVGWFSWADAVKQFLDAKNKDNLLKVWVNTVLGETWLEKGEAPEWQVLFDKREDYRQELVPSGGLFLTAGADVQKDRIECEVVAWGRNHESWSVGYFIINGDTAREDVWNELTDFSRRYFEHSSGAMLPISRFAIDSGFATQQVYNWVRKQPLNFAMAVKGTDSGVTPLGLPTKVDLNINGKKLRRGAKVWTVGTSILKSELYQFLRLTQNEDESFPAGYCHFPKYDSEYFKQLTAEQLVTKVVRGYQKREWQKTRERNEALDCRIYARAASICFGIEQFSETKWRNLEKTLIPEKQETAEIPVKKKTKISFSPNIVKAQDPYL